MRREGMIYTTTPDVPGREITEILGIVTGNVVQSKHVGRDIMAGLKSVVGGEIKSYTDMLTEARHKAISRLVDEAVKMNADAVVNLRFTTSSIMSGASEILAYGTAVKLKPQKQMQYEVIDPRYFSNKDTNVMFASNDKQEAIFVADEIGAGTVVVRCDESGLREIVYIASYKSDLSLSR